MYLVSWNHLQLGNRLRFRLMLESLDMQEINYLSNGESREVGQCII